MQSVDNDSDPDRKLRPDYASAFRLYLDPGERMHWFGQPRKKMFLRPLDTAMFSSSLMWEEFAIFWEVFAISITRGKGSPLAKLMFLLAAIPFFMVGLGQFIVDAWLRDRTCYGLTDRRAMIPNGCFSSQFVSYEIDRLEQIRITTHADVTATINFEDEVTSNRRSRSFSLTGRSQAAFEGVADGAEASRLVRELQQPGTSR